MSLSKVGIFFLPFLKKKVTQIFPKAYVEIYCSGFYQNGPRNTEIAG